MSTNAAIIIKHRTGTAQTIYCHSDGMFEEVGRCLQEHYQNPKKVKALIALGAISRLEARVAPNEGEAHSFKNPAEGVTVAYVRDRGDSPTNRTSHSYNSLDEALLDWMGNVPYVYVFDEADGQWYGNTGPQLRQVIDAGQTFALTPLALRVNEEE